MGVLLINNYFRCTKNYDFGDGIIIPKGEIVFVKRCDSNNGVIFKYHNDFLGCAYNNFIQSFELIEDKDAENKADNEKKEMVNHPKHYGGDTTYECIKVLKAWLSPEEYKGFLKGNAIKYLCRTGKKDETIQELNKTKWYLEKLIEEEK